MSIVVDSGKMLDDEIELGQQYVKFQMKKHFLALRYSFIYIKILNLYGYLVITYIFSESVFCVLA